MKNKSTFLLILIPILLMVFGQTMAKLGALQDSLVNMFILLGYLAIISRGVVWIFVLRKLPVSFAYPFMSLGFVLILGVSYFFFNEAITLGKLLGSGLIILGVISISLGKSREVST